MTLSPVAYNDGDRALTGWLARPSGAPRAAVLVFPTIANIGDAVERRARMLADEGYLAFVADFYGFVPESMAVAQAEAEVLRSDVDRYRSRLSAALSAMLALPDVADLPQLAIGYCMGGQAALELARSGAELAGVVSFHGLLDTGRAAQPGQIRAPLLVCHGDADPMVPRAQVMAFWQEMDDALARWHFHAYGNVRHGFTDPASDTRGLAAVAYDASADRQSWAAMNAFFDEVLADPA